MLGGFLRQKFWTATWLTQPLAHYSDDLHALCETAWYRMNSTLKGPVNPKTTNQ